MRVRTLAAIATAAVLLTGICVHAGAQGAVPGTTSPPAAGSAAPTLPPVRVDAVVTDARGRRVLDLRPQDFELRAHGVAQEVRVELRRNQTPRVFAFYLDEFHVGPGAASERTRAVLTGFIERTLRPADRVVILKPLEPLSELALTSDRDALRSAVSSFAGRGGDYSPRTRFEELYIGRAPSAVAAARAQIVTMGLTELALQLGERGVDRAAIVLFSEGFTRAAPSRLRRVGDVQGLARAASRLHLALYALSPSGDARGPSRADAVDTLETLAKQTGGEAVLDPAALAEALERVAADLDNYYTLTFDPRVTDGRFHAVEVRTKRANLQVRARSGYWAPLESEWRAWLARPAAVPSAPRRELRRSPFIDAWVGIVPGADGRPEMVLSWEPSRRAASVRMPDSIVVHARTEGGATLFDGRLAGARGSGPDRIVRFPVPAGRVELDLTIPKADGTLLDVEKRDVDVPNLETAKPGPVLLPPAVMRARSAREFGAIARDPHAPPTAVRAFTRADRLLIRAPAWDSSGVQVQITARVLNVRRQPMRDVDRRESAVGSGVTEFELPLSWLAPGEYEIEITGRNANGVSVQRITFTVSN